jgi:hypothetical protein
VETIEMRELMPQSTGMPYVEPRLSMAPRRGWSKPLLGPGGPGGEAGPPGGMGAFRITCYVSHMGFEDPIVAPGREFWHHHTFVGNPRIDRYTTDPRDYADGGLCNGGSINRSGYWFPSVIDTRFGMPVEPEHAVIYYKTTGPTDTTVPENMRMLAGDPMGKEPVTTGWVRWSHWNCYTPDGRNIAGPNGQEIPPNCPVGSQLIWQIHFPGCWNGENDSADHKSHVTVEGDNTPNRCPPSHPYKISAPGFNVAFTVREGDDVSRWRLSSDAYEWNKPAGYSAHGDWWNGWDVEFFSAIKRECHDVGRDCGSNVSADRQWMNVK